MVDEQSASFGMGSIKPSQPSQSEGEGRFVSAKEFTGHLMQTTHDVGKIVGDSPVLRKYAYEDLLQSHERLAAVLNTASDAIITIDEKGCIVSANPATEKLFEYQAHELIGQNIAILMPAPYCVEHDDYIRRYLESGKAGIIGVGREVTAKRKDGSTFPIDLNVSEIPQLQLFTGIIRDISERKTLQREIVAIAEDERRRIGQDLHDSVQQELAAVRLTAQALLNKWDHVTDGISAEVASDCRQLARSILGGLARAQQELRVISRGLVPFQLESNGLIDALRELALRTDGLDGVNCAFKCEHRIDIADSSLATHLYRIAQEAVTNSLRHAKPQHILIELDVVDGNLILQVADDGSGYSSATNNGGMGMKTMRYRSSLIGASLAVTPVERGGTLVTCNVFGGGSEDAKQRFQTVLVENR